MKINRLLLSVILTGCLLSPTRAQQALHVDPAGNPTAALNIGGAKVAGTLDAARLPPSAVRNYAVEATAGIDPLLTGLTRNDAVNTAIFSSADDTAHVYVRNTSAWFAPYQADLTCVTASTSVGWRVTAIDSLHGITAHHIFFPVGGDLWFCGTDNATAHVTSTAVTNVTGDLDLVTFSAPLPATVHPALVLPATLPGGFSFAGCPVLFTQRYRQGLVCDIQNLNPLGDSLVSSTSALRTPWTANPPATLQGYPFDTGDSSSPYFLAVGGHLVLLGCSHSPNGVGPDPGQALSLLLPFLSGTTPSVVSMTGYPQVPGPVGPVGPPSTVPGPQGPAGPATVSVGTTTALPAGNAPTVTGVTSGGNLTLNFGLPAGGSPGVTSGLLYVDVLGNDSTGTRNDPARPFATGRAAQAHALWGDVIVVHPGTYSTPTAGWTALGVNGVDWYLQGAVIQPTDDQNNPPYTDPNAQIVGMTVFCDGTRPADPVTGNDGHSSYHIRGWGAITANTAQDTNAQAVALQINHPNSTIRVDDAINLYVDDGGNGRAYGIYNLGGGTCYASASTGDSGTGIVCYGGTVNGNGTCASGGPSGGYGIDCSGGTVNGNGTGNNGAPGIFCGPGTVNGNAIGGIVCYGGTFTGNSIGYPAVTLVPTVPGSEVSKVVLTGLNVASDVGTPCIQVEYNGPQATVSPVIILRGAVLVCPDPSQPCIGSGLGVAAVPVVVESACANTAPASTVTQLGNTIKVDSHVQ